ncbi:MAG: DUF2062 domain-containing protein [Desulfobacterales bacterium]|nr:DUF2062 domain-containing protein [Desulfobacterales bacterium]
MPPPERNHKDTEFDTVWSRLKGAVVRLYIRFIKLRGSPHEIALGMALGLFIGMSPFFGLHIITAVALASLLGWSKVAAAIGVNITNAATAPVIYPITYWVGAHLSGFAKEVQWPTSFAITEFAGFLKQSPLIVADLVVGGIILGLPIAVAGYFFSLRTIRFYRRRVHFSFLHRTKK